MKKIILWLLLLGSAHAEVEEIQVTWNALVCLNVCVPLIEKSLNAIKDVRDVQINASSGIAVMGWDPNYPFSYAPFRSAFAAVGIHINSMRIRVRGTITHDIDNFYLVSNGDDAKYLLIGPLYPEPGRYVPHYNLASYPLSPQVKEQFLDAERGRATVVISGPLFLPEKYPRTLITEQVKIQASHHTIDPRFLR